MDTTDLTEKKPQNEYARIHPASVDLQVIVPVAGRNWRNPETYEPPVNAAPRESWLAWEALRRNVYFQKACTEFDAGSRDPEDWGDNADEMQWGLARFKHFAEEITADEATWPSWSILSPRIIDMVSPKLVGHPAKAKWLARPSPSDSRSCLIRGGQVAAVFDLQHALFSKTLLTKQIDALDRYLQGLVKALANEPTALPTPKVPQIASVIPLLRLADAMLDREHPTRQKIIEVVYENRVPVRRKAKAETPTKEPFPGNETASLPDAWKEFQKAAALIYCRAYLRLLTKSDSPRSPQTGITQ